MRGTSVELALLACSLFAGLVLFLVTRRLVARLREVAPINPPALRGLARAAVLLGFFLMLSVPLFLGYFAFDPVAMSKESLYADVVVTLSLFSAVVPSFWYVFVRNLDAFARLGHD